MGQEEVLKILENHNHDNKITAKEVVEKYRGQFGDISQSSITISLLKLRRCRYINYDCITNGYPRNYIYRYWGKP